MDTTSSIDQMNPWLLNLNDGTTLPPPPPQPKQPGKFAAVLGKVASVAGNILMPGFGGIFGDMLGGLGVGMGADANQYLMLQERVQAETRRYEAISAVMKARHDAAMDALRNICH